MGDSKLGYKLEKMVQRLLNEFVVKDKTFRVSTPVNIEVVKRIFGHALGPKQIGRLSGHDGIVALFSNEFEDGDGGEDQVLKKNSMERRRNLRAKAGPVVKALEPYLGKPVVEVWEGLDWKNVFGNRSIYVCCFFVLDESGFTNIVTEKS